MTKKMLGEIISVRKSYRLWVVKGYKLKVFINHNEINFSNLKNVHLSIISLKKLFKIYQII